MQFQSFCRLWTVMMSAPLVGLMATFAPRAVADDREFKPIVEADMPEGFPEYTPVVSLRKVGLQNAYCVVGFSCWMADGRLEFSILLLSGTNVAWMMS